MNVNAVGRIKRDKGRSIEVGFTEIDFETGVIMEREDRGEGAVVQCCGTMEICRNTQHTHKGVGEGRRGLKRSPKRSVKIFSQNNGNGW